MNQNSSLRAPLLITWDLCLCKVKKGRWKGYWAGNRQFLLHLKRINSNFGVYQKRTLTHHSLTGHLPGPVSLACTSAIRLGQKDTGESWAGRKGEAGSTPWTSRLSRDKEDDSHPCQVPQGQGPKRTGEIVVMGWFVTITDAARVSLHPGHECKLRLHSQRHYSLWKKKSILKGSTLCSFTQFPSMPFHHFFNKRHVNTVPLYSGSNYLSSHSPHPSV